MNESGLTMQSQSNSSPLVQGASTSRNSGKVVNTKQRKLYKQHYVHASPDRIDAVGLPPLRVLTSACVHSVDDVSICASYLER